MRDEQEIARAYALLDAWMLELKEMYTPRKATDPGGGNLNLQERLQALIGHDVMVNGLNDLHDDDGYPMPDVVPGKLREVGDGYLVIETQTGDGGFADAEQLVSIRYVTSILHIFGECAGCAVDAASKARGG